MVPYILCMLCENVPPLQLIIVTLAHPLLLLKVALSSVSFFADSKECIIWSIDIGTLPGGGEIYKIGDNNYIFNQVHIPQDDTAKPTPINFRKQIPSGVKFLYASLFDSSNAYFAAPQNVTLIVDSQDGKTNYKHKTDIESLYIQMTKDGQSLQKLCVRNPEAGTWTIKIKAMTNTPVYFQF